MKPAIIEPKSGQESVWDYPRPPRIEKVNKLVKIIHSGISIAESRRAKRILETSHPPVYYIPAEDVKAELLSPADNHTFCEWKGHANYYHLNTAGNQVRYACWSYPEPVSGFSELKDHLAFYAQKVDACYVGNERVVPQPGKYYGGWITAEITGPFKGEPGSENW